MRPSAHEFLTAGRTPPEIESWGSAAMTSPRARSLLFGFLPIGLVVLVLTARTDPRTSCLLRCGAWTAFDMVANRDRDQVVEAVPP